MPAQLSDIATEYAIHSTLADQKVYSCFIVDKLQLISMFFKLRRTTELYSFRLFFSPIDCRPTKADKNSEELLAADRHVDKYKDVLEKICRKFVQNPSSTNSLNLDQDALEKRSKKVHEHKLALAIEESLKDLPDGLLRDVLDNCGKYILFGSILLFPLFS